jgi:prepilin-type N-terminal cleavage/methylation domain-containing protein
MTDYVMTRFPRSVGPRAVRGYTILECLVAMAVAATMLTLGLQLYVQTQRALSRQEVQAARLGSETDLLGLLRRDVRAAVAVAPGSTPTRLELVGLGGGRVIYCAGAEGVTRTVSPPSAPTQMLPVTPRFDCPGRGLVRISWGEGGAVRSLTLHLRNTGS